MHASQSWDVYASILLFMPLCWSDGSGEVQKCRAMVLTSRARCSFVSSVCFPAVQEPAPNPAQFIVTTFHPQIVEVADKTYGVEHSNRVSTIKPIPRDVALTFVRNDKTHEPQSGSAGGKAQAPVGDARRLSKRRKENTPSDENADGGFAADRQRVA
jgi:hypothetical protein